MNKRPICSYEGSQYSTEFWTQARSYEDAVERVALRALLPERGRRLLEIGAGFGRVVDLYTGYETIVLLDYAETQLAQAVERLGEDGPFVFVQANFYHLPFARGLFDAVTMIRTLHHATDAPEVLREVSEILGPEGSFVMEFANKQNLKAIARHLLGRQDWSPFDREPVEFVELNFDFHPKWIWEQLARVGLEREAVRTVSHFRIDLLKRMLPTRLLAALDGAVQPTGALWQLSPSVFVRSRADADKAPAPDDVFFRCPACGRPLEGLPPVEVLSCACGETWSRKGAIYDFRWPR